MIKLARRTGTDTDRRTSLMSKASSPSAASIRRKLSPALGRKAGSLAFGPQSGAGLSAAPAGGFQRLAHFQQRASCNGRKRRVLASGTLKLEPVINAVLVQPANVVIDAGSAEPLAR